MKTSKLTYLLLPLMIMCICVNMANAQEVKYIGEFCFTLTSTSFQGVPDETIQVGVLSYGAGHLSLDGNLSSRPAHGSAVLFGDSVLATLATSGPQSQRSTFSKTYDLQGGLATLSGTYTSIEFYQLNIGGVTPPYSVLIDHGTITRITCP